MIPDWAPTPDFYNEWLATNGSGAYACGSVAGAVTRRYHAFLCAALDGPQDRRVLVTKIEETLVCQGQHFSLGSNFWPNEISPRGDQFLSEFTLDPLPRWSYRVPTDAGEIALQKTVWMVPDRNTSVALYQLLDGPDCELQIRAFLAPRSYHSTQHANPNFNESLEVSEAGDALQIRPYPSQPPIHLASAGRFCADENWYRNFHWPIEAERGLDALEDAFCPGYFCLDLQQGAPKALVASTETIDLDAASASRESLIENKRALIGAGDELTQPSDELVQPSDESVQQSNVSDDWHAPGNRLRLGADQFIVKRADGLHTVLAGYPWFTDWGRDTMIALPGLCLTTRRFDVAASILRSFAGAMSQGMIPNRFPEGNETPDYNTVDATLWFFHAVFQYGHISGDWKSVHELYPKLVESIEWHLGGTRYGIIADDEDGLLRAGDCQTQLTWMDAKIGDTAFTPRGGKPVEIQALWFNALSEMASWGRCFEDQNTAGICTEWSRKVAANFAPLFWNARESCLYDCVDGDFRDGAIRPNQIFTVSLPHRLLNHEQESLVLGTVERELLTPHGLRSLSPRDSRYRGHYGGDAWSRDSAYHQGTVWGWLLGPFVTAHLRVHDGSDEAKAQAQEWLKPMIAHLGEAGLGSISEVFDGDAPHMPRGCFAQAWSVAETLRAWQEAQ